MPAKRLLLIYLAAYLFFGGLAFALVPEFFLDVYYHLPDLYDGKTFPALEAGVAHAEEVGFETIIDRGVAAVQALPEELVYSGFSLGVLPAQKLAQTRPKARAALLYHDALPVSTFGDGWPVGVPLQMHIMQGDEWAELSSAEALRDEIEGAELFVYPGSAHLFADASLAEFEPGAAGLLMQRTLEFLSRIN